MTDEMHSLQSNRGMSVTVTSVLKTQTWLFLLENETLMGHLSITVREM